MADGTPIGPRLFERDLPHDPGRPIRHPWDAEPMTPPDRVLDEAALLHAVWNAPDHICWWPANTVNRRLADRMAEHGWLDVDDGHGFTPSDDGMDAMARLDAGRPAPDWDRPVGALF